MAITDQMTAATKERFIGPVVNIQKFQSPTVAAFMQKKRIETGIAGNGFRVIPRILRRVGQFYRGFETLGRNVDPTIQAYFIDWYNLATPLGIAGEDLRRNVGLTVEQLSKMDSVGALNDMQESRFVNLIANELEAGADDHYYREVQSFHSKQPGPSPESFNELFDTTSNFQGLSRSALGSFASDDPWSADKPGGPTQTTAYLNEPRIYDNSGTLRTISLTVLSEPIRRSRRYTGDKIMPLHPTLFATVADEFLGQYHLNPGPSRLVVGYDSIRYLDCEIFEDEFAPTNKGRLFNLEHYFPVCWSPNDTNLLRAMMTKPETMQAVWFGDWRIGDRQDAVLGYLHSMYALYCDLPPAQVEVRDLQP